MCGGRSENWGLRSVDGGWCNWLIKGGVLLGYGMAMGCLGCDCSRASSKCAFVREYLSITQEWSSFVRSASMSVVGGEFLYVLRFGYRDLDFIPNAIVYLKNRAFCQCCFPKPCFDEEISLINRLKARCQFEDQSNTLPTGFARNWPCTSGSLGHCLSILSVSPARRWSMFSRVLCTMLKV